MRPLYVRDGIHMRPLYVRRWIAEDQTRVLTKDLEDGSKAVGLFNRGEFAATVTVNFADLKVTGPRTVRDLWRQKMSA